ncbi:hypothetical protein AGLY_016312 [Aphis glycines]|uniref:PiggyBac transposable element-derived protein domain-containing protein n=1 Tax=Aphis glycines TaxID=307491 RepID=A0A6G0SZH8_APHGL|nr:hypothetical protein AGLY_016312 [Aphis glycines]
MSSRQENLIEQFLSDEIDSDESIMYDSNTDPKYILALMQSRSSNNDDINKSYTGQETSTSNTDDLNIPIGRSDLDDDDISVVVSSSDEDYDLSDSDLWVDTEKDIPDFNFDSTLSGIKINVPEFARESPIDIFKLLWTDDIFEININSTYNYGHKNKTKNRPHNKYFRKTTFNETNKDEMQNFFGICLFLGSAFRTYVSLLHGLEVCDDGPIRKINLVYTLLIQNFQKAIYPDESLLLDRGRFWIPSIH